MKSTAGVRREWGEGSVSDLIAWEPEQKYFVGDFALYVQMLHGMEAFLYCEWWKN
jgi:hypothetical protein